MQPPRLLGESQDDGFGWRATASGLSPSNRGGCASSRLDHGLKFCRIQGGCASSRLIHDFPSPNNSKKHQKNILKNILPFWSFIHPHQRCGYSNSPFVRIHYFYTAGSGNETEGMDLVCPHGKKHVDPIKNAFLL